ncbi:hypothetical protein [Halostella litorea]|uniref:hypothetical protein n=1 Tax=Halostella litorea TaxID=2528831 RepID=UPI0010918AEA|nr:hypothetical protein [Halostella litorea]
MQPSKPKPTTRLARIFDGRSWAELRMDVGVAMHNRDRLTAVWCIVCGRAATEDHPWRFHQAGGCLAGPFCCGWCAGRYLQDGSAEDGGQPDVRTTRRAEV